MKCRYLSSAVLLALAACDAPTVSAPEFQPQYSMDPGSAIPWVSLGKVHIIDPYRSDNEAWYQYHARNDKSGTRGKFAYETKLYAGSLVSSGDVVCMTVVVLPDGTRKARIGGIVTKTNRPEIPLGHEFVWSVTDDNPKTGQVETAGLLLGLQEPGFARRYCAFGLPYPENPVKPGYIHIYRSDKRG